MKPQSSLNISHVVLETGLQDLVEPTAGFRVALPGIPAHSMESKPAHANREVGMVRSDHAAFAGSHVFRGVEAEANGAAMGSDFLALILGAGSMGGVFNHRNAVPSGE